MQTDPDTGVTALSVEECWESLRAAQVGRLALAISGEPELFPVNYVVDDSTVVFRTAEGTKLAALTISSRVAFESDGYLPDTDEAWSVVVKGTAERLEHFADIYAAEGLPLHPWQAGQKQWFVRIIPDRLTGFRFPVVHDFDDD